MAIQHWDMKINLLLVLSLAISAQLTAQSWKKTARSMTKHERPFFYYQLINPQPTRTLPKVGDQLHIQYTLQTLGKKPEILVQSYELRTPTLVQLPAPQFDNYFTASLRLMAAGDSMRVLVPADSIRKDLGDMSKFFKPKDAVLFTYKVLEIKTKTQIEQEIAQEKQRTDQLRMRMAADLLAYRNENSNLLQKLQTTPTGLQYIIYQQGTGKPVATSQTAQVHYICMLMGGNEVDNSYTRAEPLTADFAAHQTIKGWEEGVKLLHEGGQALLIIPPHLAYGAAGMPPIIPPNTSLAYLVEILQAD